MRPSSRTARRGRPPRLSREAILAAAMRVHLDELSMHGLARELGVAPSALYRWVGSRDELLDMVGDAVLERITPAPLAPGDDWRPWLAELGRTMRREFLAVPGYVSRLVRPHRHSEAYERLVRSVTGVLEDAGVTADDAVQSWYVFATSVVGWVAVEQERVEPLDPAPRFEALLATLLAGLPVAGTGGG